MFSTISTPNFAAGFETTQAATEALQPDVDREAYQQTLDGIFGYIILGICILAVLGAVLGFGSIRVNTGGGGRKAGSSNRNGGSSGGGGASGNW